MIVNFKLNGEVECKEIVNFFYFISLYLMLLYIFIEKSYFKDIIRLYVV